MNMWGARTKLHLTRKREKAQARFKHASGNRQRREKRTNEEQRWRRIIQQLDRRGGADEYNPFGFIQLN